MIDALIRAGVGPTQARMFAEPLEAAMALHDILTPRRKAAFIAQAMLESARFTRMEENLFYTTPARIAAVWPSRFKNPTDATPYARDPKKLANKVYAERNGNGDEDSGDGWRYRGRGIFQLTGRSNYAKASNGLGRNYLAAPETVALPTDACLTAAWYWRSNGCNEAVDAGNFDATTRKINGPAMLHAAERTYLFDQVREVLA